MVWESYLNVSKKQGGAGIDRESIEQFDASRNSNLYKLWNRMRSGSYFPPAVRTVFIPKKQGGLRPLGIPTVTDRIAQGVVKNYLEPSLEAVFHPSSFGYRPNKSAHDALEQCHTNCMQKAWVLDVDIKGFFDNISHRILLDLLQQHTQEKWVLMYVERWLKAPVEHEDGRLEYPTKGSPQGGVISPLLSNLYLHYTFDKWMSIHNSEIEFERFADDIVVHCASKPEAERLLASIRERFEQCGLILHAEKTKIVYCKNTNRKGNHEHVSFDFLGLTFKPKKSKNLTTGKIFTSFGPDKISKKSTKKIVDTIREKQIHRKMTTNLPDLALEMADHLRGWINSYFGRFKLHYLRPVMHYLNDRLVNWARKRYKRFKRSLWRARQWLREIYQDYPNMFVHWKYGFKP